MDKNNPAEKMEYNAYDINLTQSYAELLSTLNANTYNRPGISQDEYLSRIKGGIESYSNYNNLGSLGSGLPIIVRYPANSYHAHLAFQVMTLDINKIPALLDYQHEQYVGINEFPKIVEHGVYDWIKHNTPFDNKARLQKIVEWVEKRRGTLYKTNKTAIKIGNEILNQFKKAKCDVGQIIMSRNVGFMYGSLIPPEKKIFDKVLQGLIIDGFIDYDASEPSFFRLGQRGYRRIYEEQEDELPFQDIQGKDVLPTVIILTAIKEEYAAVRSHLIELDDCKKDSVTYEQGVFAHDGKRIARVYIRECGAKNSTAAQETQRALTNFRPDCILFVGIAGSRKPQDFRLGDVIFPEKVHYYEGGKAELEGLKPRSDDVRPTFALYEIAKLERHKEDWKQMIKTKLAKEVSADIGVIASGEQVVEHYDSETGKVISAYYGDSACIEMEGYGFLNTINRQGAEFAATFAGVIRGVSDVLSQEIVVSKNESNQDRRPPDAKKIASENAAAFAFWLVYKAYL